MRLVCLHQPLYTPHYTLKIVCLQGRSHYPVSTALPFPAFSRANTLLNSSNDNDHDKGCGIFSAFGVNVAALSHFKPSLLWLSGYLRLLGLVGFLGHVWCSGALGLHRLHSVPVLFRSSGKRTDTVCMLSIQCWRWRRRKNWL